MNVQHVLIVSEPMYSSQSGYG